MTRSHPVKKIPLADLIPYDRNPRKGDVEQIRLSLEHFGQFKTIVVNKGTHTGVPNQVLAGNHTVFAARELGWEELQCTLVDVDADTAARIVLADNRSADRAEYDEDVLLELLQSLPTLEGTGYEAEDVSDLLAQMEEEAAALTAKQEREIPLAPHEKNGKPAFPDREVWEESARRLVVLDFPRDQYVWVQEAFEQVGDQLGTESNADTVVALLKEKLGE